LTSQDTPRSSCWFLNVTEMSSSFTPELTVVALRAAASPPLPPLPFLPPPLALPLALPAGASPGAPPPRSSASARAVDTCAARRRRTLQPG